MSVSKVGPGGAGPGKTSAGIPQVSKSGARAQLRMLTLPDNNIKRFTKVLQMYAEGRALKDLVPMPEIKDPMESLFQHDVVGDLAQKAWQRTFELNHEHQGWQETDIDLASSTALSRHVDGDTVESARPEIPTLSPDAIEDPSVSLEAVGPGEAAQVVVEAEVDAVSTLIQQVLLNIDIYNMAEARILVREADADLRSKAEEVDTAMPPIFALLAALDEADEQVTASTEARAAKQARIAELEAEVEEKVQEAKAAVAARKAQVTINRDLREDSAQLSEQVRIAQEERATAQQARDTAEEQRVAAEEALARAETAREGVQEGSQRAAEQARTAVTRAERRAAQARAAEETAVSALRVADERITALETALEEAQAATEAARAEAVAAREEAASAVPFIDQVEALAASFEEAKAAVSTLEKTIKGIETRIRRIRGRAKTQDGVVSEAREARDTATGRRDDILAAIATSTEAWEGRRDTTRDELVAQRAEETRLEEAIALIGQEAETEMAALAAEQTALEAERDALAAQIEVIFGGGEVEAVAADYAYDTAAIISHLEEEESTSLQEINASLAELVPEQGLAPQITLRNDRNALLVAAHARRIEAARAAVAEATEAENESLATVQAEIRRLVGEQRALLSEMSQAARDARTENVELRGLQADGIPALQTDLEAAQSVLDDLNAQITEARTSLTDKKATRKALRAEAVSIEQIIVRAHSSFERALAPKTTRARAPRATKKTG